MTLEVGSFSKRYSVRKLTEPDTERIFGLCSRNPLYYRHCPPFVTRESIREDMTVLPPHTEPRQKYYVGFEEGERLIAVLDLIEGYPKLDTAFIGFFMTEHDLQGRGIGSAIIGELLACLKEQGFASVRLAWVKDNPQAEHFWRKNGFVPFGETANNGPYVLTLADKML